MAFEKKRRNFTKKQKKTLQTNKTLQKKLQKTKLCKKKTLYKLKLYTKKTFPKTKLCKKQMTKVNLEYEFEAAADLLFADCRHLSRGFFIFIFYYEFLLSSGWKFFSNSK